MNIEYKENPLTSIVTLNDDDMVRLRDAIRKEQKEFDEYSSEESLNKFVDCLVVDLTESHGGDCTCAPCSCPKCYAEDILGIDTVPNMTKRIGYYVHTAFKDGRNPSEALAHLEDFVVNGWAEGNEEYVTKFKREAKESAEWLRSYLNEHNFLEKK